MGLFSAIVKTTVEAAMLPVSVAKDAVTLGRVGEDESFTAQRLRRIKDAADDKDEREMDEPYDMF